MSLVKHLSKELNVTALHQVLILYKFGILLFLRVTIHHV